MDMFELVSTILQVISKSDVASAIGFDHLASSDIDIVMVFRRYEVSSG